MAYYFLFIYLFTTKNGPEGNPDTVTMEPVGHKSPVSTS